MKKLVFLVSMLTVFALQSSYSQDRWRIEENGAIRWTVDERTPHSDHIEMSGLQMSAVLRYGVGDDGAFILERSMVWPMLRTIPNNTHGSLMRRFAIDIPSLLMVDGRPVSGEKVVYMELDGRLTVVSRCFAGGAARRQGGDSQPGIELIRSYFPSVDKPMLCESYTVKNISGRPFTLTVPELRTVYRTDPDKGVDGVYTMVVSIPGGGRSVSVEPGGSFTFGVSVQAFKEGQDEISADIPAEEAARMAFVDEVWSKLRFRSPEPVLDAMFAFAKIRASESIYKTAGGLMHGPGGESYYAAIWANDQAEYANPFFPYLGYANGNESAYNSFLHFARYMNPEYKPIPSSIIAEGEGYWNGAGDRGDAAMIAYGAARYALARADRDEARELWPLIEWCLEFCERNLNEHGVVASDSDELENRFPSGDANLCTSSLYYDALISASYLAAELGKPSSVSREYTKRAAAMKTNIGNYFGSTVEGFETYRYYDGNDILRSWIAIPLTVGISERKQGTIAALFSPRLWTENGLLTQAGTETFWDRSTLYALRGVYAAGETGLATDYLKRYSHRRLLGDHVPYAIEAWPEGGQRHLSAESALYCRIITEGLFGLRPAGFNVFYATPRLPDGWDSMELADIQAYTSHPFDIRVTRSGKKILTEIIRDGRTVARFTTDDGAAVRVSLK